MKFLRNVGGETERVGGCIAGKVNEKKGGDEDDLKSVFRLLAEDKKNTLVRSLMSMITEKYELRGSKRDAFWSPAPDYPN